MAAMALLACLLIGCSAAPSSDSSTAPPATAPARPAAIPDDGVTLASLGFLNGPVEQFSLPRTATITAKVDQPNNLVAVEAVARIARVSRFRRVFSRENFSWP